MPSVQFSAAPDPHTDWHTRPVCRSVFCDGGFAFNLSAQGESHIQQHVPCQDHSRVELVHTADGLFAVAAAADGVGSCRLSHYGSCIAVNVAVTYLAVFFQQHPHPGETGCPAEVLPEAFALSQQAVERYAQDHQLLAYSFFSTLTVAVYHNGTLWYGHIGDDGIVALSRDGAWRLLTTRHKGDEASSVRPLQSGSEAWEFGCAQDISAFALLTDGLLDRVVGDAYTDCMVYAPFFTALLPSGRADAGEVEALFARWTAALTGEEGRQGITDDLTVAVAGDTAALCRTAVQPFEESQWNERIERRSRVIHEKLYGQPVQDAPTESPVGEAPSGCDDDPIAQLEAITARHQQAVRAQQQSPPFPRSPHHERRPSTAKRRARRQ